ncbi:DUF4845 domain-containing protein [Luteimonas aquatica]|uniref:DUF4845 domain-containing protein n=1 Tax=Luteimonas aquatica TaxID=450364 RepID=UPI001F577B80|nr:DUF4845 domain-containing protein [Luteimonas aquatica]
MKRTQRGMSLLGFVITLGVVGFFAYVGMQLFPMYYEYYSVKQALKGLQKEPGIAEQDVGSIKTLFFKRLDISYSESVKSKDVSFERADTGGWKMIVDYEVRKPLLGNIDIVGKFHADAKLGGNGN